MEREEVEERQWRFRRGERVEGGGGGEREEVEGRGRRRRARRGKRGRWRRRRERREGRGERYHKTERRMTSISAHCDATRLQRCLSMDHHDGDISALRGLDRFKRD